MEILGLSLGVKVKVKVKDKVRAEISFILGFRFVLQEHFLVSTKCHANICRVVKINTASLHKYMILAMLMMTQVTRANSHHVHVTV